MYSILITLVSHLYRYSTFLLVDLADIPYEVFNGCNLFRTCNNHVYKCFHFINFVTLAYIKRNFLRMMYKHRNI